jgi:hypothetical protein
VRGDPGLCTSNWTLQQHAAGVNVGITLKRPCELEGMCKIVCWQAAIASFTVQPKCTADSTPDMQRVDLLLNNLVDDAGCWQLPSTWVIHTVNEHPDYSPPPAQVCLVFTSS